MNKDGKAGKDESIAERFRPHARDTAHAILFLVAVALIIKGGILSSPADLGLIAAATTILGLIGIARA